MERESSVIISIAKIPILFLFIKPMFLERPLNYDLYVAFYIHILGASIFLHNFNALKCLHLHVATLLKINRTSKNKQIMNDLTIEFGTYMAIFFLFIFLCYGLA